MAERSYPVGERVEVGVDGALLRDLAVAPKVHQVRRAQLERAHQALHAEVRDPKRVRHLHRHLKVMFKGEVTFRDRGAFP